MTAPVTVAATPPRPGSADAARDLHVLLERAHAPRPYVIAGHSLGGMFALSYAQRYPTQVGGVVLLDSMHPHQHNAFAGTDRLLAVLPTLARMGLARRLLRSEGRQADDAGRPVRPRRRRDAGRARPGGQADEPRATGPLAVVTAGTGSAARLDRRTERPRHALEQQRSPHRRRLDAPVAHRRQARRGPIEPRHRRRRQGGTARNVADAMRPMRPTASTRRRATP